MNEEMLQKAKAAQSPEELLKMAHEIGMEDFTEEDAKAQFEAMHCSGELTDDELENAAGGCKVNGHTVVTCDRKCHCGKWEAGYSCGYCKRSDNPYLRDIWYGTSIGSNVTPNICGTCYNLGFKAGTGYCEID